MWTTNLHVYTKIIVFMCTTNVYMFSVRQQAHSRVTEQRMSYTKQWQFWIYSWEVKYTTTKFWSKRWRCLYHRFLHALLHSRSEGQRWSSRRVRRHRSSRTFLVSTHECVTKTLQFKNLQNISKLKHFCSVSAVSIFLFSLLSILCCLCLCNHLYHICRWHLHLCCYLCLRLLRLLRLFYVSVTVTYVSVYLSAVINITITPPFNHQLDISKKID